MKVFKGWIRADRIFEQDRFRAENPQLKPAQVWDCWPTPPDSYFTGNVAVKIGSTRTRNWEREETEVWSNEVRESTWNHWQSHQLSDPQRFSIRGERTAYYWYQHVVYVDVNGLEEADGQALLLAKELRRQQAVKRAHVIVALQQVPRQERHKIPNEVKELVRQRDGGSCVTCGSGSELEFDHIIPASKGGADTFRNLQILCAPCNRSKGADLF